MHYRYPLYPIFVILSLILFTGCPEQEEPLECGPHQIELDGECECMEGYHWNTNNTDCVLDTTNHNFVWEIETLGNYGSYLNDVAIVDENNIWVVGNIETDSGRFNTAHWDGYDWKLIRLLYNGIVNQGRAIFIQDDYLLVSAGSLFYSWDGITWEEWNIDIGTFPGGINVIWGSSPNNIYFVGNSGSIVHYDGSVFTRMESGTEVDLIDIYGVDESNIWIVGDDDDLGVSIVLKYENESWTTKFLYTYNEIPTDYPEGKYRSVWAHMDTVYIRCGTVLWKESITTGDGYGEDRVIYPAGGTNRLRGIHYNDIIDVGYCQKVVHYNGDNWKRLLPHDCNYFDFNSLDYHPSGIAVIVGSNGMVFTGKR